MFVHLELRREGFNVTKVTGKVRMERKGKNLAKDATSLWMLSQRSGSYLLQGKGSQRLCRLRLHTVACMVVWTAETRPEHRDSALLQPRVLCGDKVWGGWRAGGRGSQAEFFNWTWR